MKWSFFKPRRKKTENIEPIDLEDVFSDVPESSNVSDKPPEFLGQRWVEFNSQFNDEEFLVEGRPKRGDCLGRAAVLKKKATVAVKEKEFDIAWWIYNTVQALYLEHATKRKFDNKAVIGIDSSISREMANVLRLEGKHQQALVHILYWQLGEARPQVKRDIKKLKAYYNRSKLTLISFDQMIEWMDSYQGLANYSTIQAKVAGWISNKDT